MPTLANDARLDDRSRRPTKDAFEIYRTTYRTTITTTMMTTTPAPSTARASYGGVTRGSKMMTTLQRKGGARVATRRANVTTASIRTTEKPETKGTTIGRTDARGASAMDAIGRSRTVANGRRSRLIDEGEGLEGSIWIGRFFFSRSRRSGGLKDVSRRNRRGKEVEMKEYNVHVTIDARMTMTDDACVWFSRRS